MVNNNPLCAELTKVSQDRARQIAIVVRRIVRDFLALERRLGAPGAGRTRRARFLPWAGRHCRARGTNRRYYL